MEVLTVLPPQTSADTLLACYTVAGVPVRVAVTDPALGARVEAWLGRALTLVDGRMLGEPVLLKVMSGGVLPDPPAGTREFAPTADCRVLRGADRVFLRFPQTRCELDLAGGQARVWLSEDWWNQPLKTQQDPWVLSLAWLLRERGIYALHASCVARDGQGLLIAGRSGSGKSSTALSLIHRGWDWLADDVVLLEPGAPARLHCLAQGFSFHPGLADRLPWLHGEVLGPKRFADIQTILPGCRLETCVAAGLLFPRVIDGQISRIERLSPAEALMALLHAVGGILAGGPPEQSQAQLAALRDLIPGVPACRLHAAWDTFGEGALLEALLAEGGVAGPA